MVQRHCKIHLYVDDSYQAIKQYGYPKLPSLLVYKVNSVIISAFIRRFPLSFLWYVSEEKTRLVAE